MKDKLLKLITHPTFWSPLSFGIGALISHFSADYAILGTISAPVIAHKLGKLLLSLSEDFDKTESKLDDVIHAVGKSLNGEDE